MKPILTTLEALYLVIVFLCLGLYVASMPVMYLCRRRG